MFKKTTVINLYNFDLEEKEAKIVYLEEKMAKPDFWLDRNHAEKGRHEKGHAEKGMKKGVKKGLRPYAL